MDNLNQNNEGGEIKKDYWLYAVIVLSVAVIFLGYYLYMTRIDEKQFDNSVAQKTVSSFSHDDYKNDLDSYLNKFVKSHDLTLSKLDDRGVTLGYRDGDKYQYIYNDSESYAIKGITCPIYDVDAIGSIKIAFLDEVLSPITESYGLSLSENLIQQFHGSVKEGGADERGYILGDKVIVYVRIEGECSMAPEDKDFSAAIYVSSIKMDDLAASAQEQISLKKQLDIPADTAIVLLGEDGGLKTYSLTQGGGGWLLVVKETDIGPVKIAEGNDLTVSCDIVKKYSLPKKFEAVDCDSQ